MFILKKILNSNTTSPDTSRMFTASEGYHYGSFLRTNSEGILFNISNGDRPTHVCCENQVVGSMDKLLCYPITEDMIFSAVASVSMANINPGTKLSLTQYNSSNINAVSGEDPDGNVYVYDTCGATKPGDRILIKFVK